MPGVTSISIDTHKYGFGFKGSSVVLFKPHTLRRFHYYVMNGWPGGLYGSPGIAGSRSGGIIASTWAAMLSLGKDGDLVEVAPGVSRGMLKIEGTCESLRCLERGSNSWPIRFRPGEIMPNGNVQNPFQAATGGLNVLPILVVLLFYKAPVDDAPECFYIIGAAVLVIQVISVFPNIQPKHGEVPIHEGAVLIGGRVYLQFLFVFSTLTSLNVLTI